MTFGYHIICFQNALLSQSFHVYIYAAPSRNLVKRKSEERPQRRTQGQNRLNRWPNGGTKIALVSARSACLSEDVSQGRQMQQLISKAGTSRHISYEYIYIHLFIDFALFRKMI